jgi:hypothetical protein
MPQVNLYFAGFHDHFRRLWSGWMRNGTGALNGFFGAQALQFGRKPPGAAV